MGNEKRYLKNRMVMTEISGERYFTIVAIAIRVKISRRQVAIPNELLSIFSEFDGAPIF